MWRTLLVLAISVVLVGCPLGGRETVDIWVVVNLYQQSELDDLTGITLDDGSLTPSVVVPLDIGVLEPGFTHIYDNVPLDQFAHSVKLRAVQGGASL